VSLKKLFGSLSGAGTGSKLFSVMRPRSAQSEACRHPLVLGAVVKCGAQPGAGTSLAGLNNSRCRFADRMLRNLGAAIHCFEQLMHAIFLGSSLTTIDCKRSEFKTIKIRDARQSELWGRSEMEGTWSKRSYALAHAHSLKFEN